MTKNISYPVIDMVKTGENIKKLREEQNISVAEVQNFLGISNPQAIYQWQKGISLPSVDHLCALSHLFGIPMNDIIVLANAPESSPSAQREVVRRIPFLAQTMMLLAVA